MYVVLKGALQGSVPVRNAVTGKPLESLIQYDNMFYFYMIIMLAGIDG